MCISSRRDINKKKMKKRKERKNKKKNCHENRANRFLENLLSTNNDAYISRRENDRFDLNVFARGLYRTKILSTSSIAIVPTDGRPSH